MPEPFKEQFSLALIKNMADCFAQAHQDFAHDEFIKAASHKLHSLELKQRSKQITQAMHQCLPKDFGHSARILLSSLCPMQDPNHVSQLQEHAHLLKAWPIMPMADYVASFQHSHFTLCMELLYEMTQRFSVEFAIRFLLIEQQEKTLKILKQWVNDESEHVRRLVSEGTRPRLPWGIQLTEFVKDPSPVLPLLEALKDDNSEYVRRSVANNLNDIAKDHPHLLIKIANAWLVDADDARTRLVRHACRTLFKQSHPEALALFGFFPLSLTPPQLSLKQSSVHIGKSIEFALTLSSSSNSAQRVMLDYVIYHQKANGKHTPKVFKWKVLTLAPHQTIHLNKAHSFKLVTTRKYYAGEHRLSVLLNGKEFANSSFCLLPEK